MDNVVLKENVQLNVKSRNWKEAIESAGKLLEKSGVITRDYTNSMIDAVEEFGPYIVLAPEIAFAHSRPTADVKGMGISLITLETPVEFGHEQNDPVGIVVAIASNDHTSHIQLLKKVVDFMDDCENVKFLRNASTEDDLTNILKRINGG